MKNLKFSGACVHLLRTMICWAYGKMVSTTFYQTLKFTPNILYAYIPALLLYVIPPLVCLQDANCYYFYNFKSTSSFTFIRVCAYIIIIRFKFHTFKHSQLGYL